MLASLELSAFTNPRMNKPVLWIFVSLFTCNLSVVRAAHGSQQLPSAQSSWVCPSTDESEMLDLLQRSATLQSTAIAAMATRGQEGVELLELESHLQALYSPAGLHAACLASAFVALIVVIVYWPQGPVVIVRILIYMFALASMKLSVKFVYVQFGFNFPKFLTAGHLLLSGAVGFLLTFARRKPGELVYPSAHDFCCRIGPIAAAFAFSLAMNNSALVFCSAAYAEIVGATTPIITVVLTVLMGLPFNKWLLVPTMVAMVGCSLSVSGEVNISVIGTVLCFLANLGRAVKGVFQQDVLTRDSQTRYDPSMLLAWTCTTSFVIMLFWSAFSEGQAPWQTLQSRAADTPLLSMAILASCLNACVLNFVVLYVTKDLGAVGQLIVGQVASVLTVGGGIVIFGDHLSHMQVCGFMAVLGAAFAYSRMSKALDAKPRA
mmetsp:Transcript_25509/g.55885  ORF Transcript_25509/g.55885 Transcript_25509/m.55885 type:complete len:434 (+) Transcript_25509:18-1319(+)